MNKFHIETLKVIKSGFYWEEGDEGYVVYLNSEVYELLKNLVKDGDYETIEEAIRGTVSFIETHYRTYNNLELPRS